MVRSRFGFVRLGAAGLLAVAALLAGCASGPAPIDHFYRLDPPSVQARLSAAPLAGTLEVNRFRADALAGGRALVYRRNPETSELHRSAYHLWSDAPPVMLQNVFATYLRDAGVATAVVTPDLRVAPDYVLAGRIVHLQRLIGTSPTVELELELSLSREADRTLLLQRSYRETGAPGGAAVADAVTALSDALTRVLERFVADLSRASDGTAAALR